MLRGVLFSMLFVALGCSSSDFQVAPNDNDSSATGETDDTMTGDGTASMDVDTKPDPCAPEPGKAKFCMTITASAEHPAYDTSEGAALKLDGRGRIYISLYAVDPIENRDATPIATIPYPPDTEVGAEVDISKGLSLTIPGTVATPGTYTAVAFFADSVNMRGKGSASVLPGDYLTIPSVSGMKVSYPKLTVETDKTATVTMPVKLVRAVTMTLTPAAALKAKGPTVHGDGPVLFALTDDSSITGTTKWLHFDAGGCVDLDVEALAPRSQDITFNTVVDPGPHNVFAAVFDYSTNVPYFPGRGTLVSAQSGSLPKVDIRKDQWTAKTTVNMVDVAIGSVEAGTVDMLTCPAMTL